MLGWLIPFAGTSSGFEGAVEHLGTRLGEAADCRQRDWRVPCHPWEQEESSTKRCACVCAGGHALHVSTYTRARLCAWGVRL